MSVIRIRYKDDKGRRCTSFCDIGNIKAVELIDTKIYSKAELEKFDYLIVTDKEKLKEDPLYKKEVVELKTKWLFDGGYNE